jgi:hypothetical protein
MTLLAQSVVSTIGRICPAAVVGVPAIKAIPPVP